MQVKSSGSFPDGLAENTNYFVVSIDRQAGWLRLGTTQDGPPIILSDAGTGTHTLRAAYNSLKTYNGSVSQIGLPRLRGSGENAYYEYRPQHLQFGLAANGDQEVLIGIGYGSGSGLLRLDLGTDQASVTAYTTAGTAEINAPSLNLVNSHESTTVTNVSADLGLAYFEGQETEVGLILHQAGQLRGGDITCGSLRFRTSAFSFRRLLVTGEVGYDS